MTAPNGLPATEPGSAHDDALPSVLTSGALASTSLSAVHAAGQGRRRIAAVFGGAALALAVGACGSGSAPASPASSGPSGSTVGAASNLKLDEADPCRVLSEQDAARLGVGPGVLVTSTQAQGKQACRLTNFPDKPDSTPGKTYLVQLLDNPGKLDIDDGAVPPIDNLVTKRGTSSGSLAGNTCVYILSLAPQASPDQTTPDQSTPGRYLWAQYANLAGDNPSMNHQTACENAAAGATAAIKSLNQTAG